MMEAKVPLIIVQFQQDYFCNPQKYSNWYGRIIAAVQAHRAEPSFLFLTCRATTIAPRSWQHTRDGKTTAPSWAPCGKVSGQL